MADLLGLLLASLVAGGVGAGLAWAIGSAFLRHRGGIARTAHH